MSVLHNPPPPEAVANLGHDLVWDPTLTSTADRWHCAACGRTLTRAHAGHLSGTVFDGPCPGPPV